MRDKPHNQFIHPISKKIPKGVWVLGVVSLLMDMSSEMIHSLLPLFMVNVLAADVTTVGLIEGAAEATAQIVKVISGFMSDRFGKRKSLALLGYGLSALTKPLFAVAASNGMILNARLLDRVGKGIRGAPRDALVSEIAPTDMRGAAFGLRQSLDTVGAFLGPMLAACLMLLWQSDFRMIFWLAATPGYLAVLVLFLGIEEPARAIAPKHSYPVGRRDIRRLSRTYWLVVAVGAIFTLARFSEAFLVLRAQQCGIPVALAPSVMAAMSVVYAATAYPFGKFSDRAGHRILLGSGVVMLMVADLILALGKSWESVFVGVLFWGIHMGMTQGLLAKMVADTTPQELRGTAYGFFNLMSGIAMLFASISAGILWDHFGAAFTFYAGAGLSGLVLISLMILGRLPNVH